MRPVLSAHESISGGLWELLGKWYGAGGRIVPLTWLQVDVIGPSPSSEGYKYTITCVDTATGLLASYPARHKDQKAVITVFMCCLWATLDH